MDYFFLIVSGVVIGLAVAVPIGPVNLICIRRTLAFGPLNGFVSGLGAAIGDTVFAIVTGFGLTVIAQLIKGYSSLLELLGGGMLLYFGVHTFVSKVETRLVDKIAMKEKGASTLFRAMASTFALPSPILPLCSGLPRCLLDWGDWPEDTPILSPRPSLSSAWPVVRRFGG